MAVNSRILIIDDDKWSLKLSREILEQKKYSVDTALGGKQGAELIRNKSYDLVLTDMKMEDYNGIDILRIAKAQSYKPSVIVMTGYGSIETAVEVMKLGSLDYIQKPLDNEQAMRTIALALKKAEMNRKAADLAISKKGTSCYKKMISENTKMKELFKRVDLVSASDVAVLIEGESGTGKELIARSIHHRGTRAKRPFVAVNCSALPEPLLESELFGHVKGAFTGAHQEKKGLFEEADRGTLFLDEIGDLPISLQVKILRVLQERELRKVGGTGSTKVDFRLISATNKNLATLIKEKKFREDLYYRLKVVPIMLPPLRERKDDVCLLLDHFLKETIKKFWGKQKRFSDEALTVLKNYTWPGNIRELENLVEGAVILSSSSVITLADLKPMLHIPETAVTNKRSLPGNLELDLNLGPNTSLKSKFSIAEKNYIMKALAENKWNQVKTARELGIGRTTLWRKIKTMGLNKTL